MCLHVVLKRVSKDKLGHQDKTYNKYKFAQ